MKFHISFVQITLVLHYRVQQELYCVKEGFINEEIVRRYPGSNNGGNNIVDRGKGGGSRSHDYWRVVAEELGDLDANMSGGDGTEGKE